MQNVNKGIAGLLIFVPEKNMMILLAIASLFFNRLLQMKSPMHLK
jgi:hypothetical protein